jgi:DNA-binding NtrC family response regulator
MRKKENFRCLIVEDDVEFAMLAGGLIREEGGAVTHCGNLAAARATADTQPFDVILLDNHLPDGKGYDFFEHLARRFPEAPIIMITGIPDLGEAVALTRNGLFDYLTKPISIDDFKSCLARALLRISSRPGETRSDLMIGDSPALKEALSEISQAARHATSTVLFTGETGAGKDVAARTLHHLTHANGKAPFVAVNCAALPAEMFESELFGAEKGAYTGADRKRVGLAGAVAGGTLFLDEIGEVPMALQAKLLRLLEAREYRSLGSSEDQKFTGRFVAATNRNLADEVKAGRFREDLLYRLDVFSIELPPLRRRRSDIPKLAEHLLAQLAQRYERLAPLLRPDDINVLTQHDFPGNIRELRNVLERSLLKTAETEHWLKLDVNWLKRTSASAMPEAPPPSPTPASVPRTSSRELTPIEAEEYRLIGEALKEANGGIRRAAAKLAMSPQALLRRLEKWPELRSETK